MSKIKDVGNLAPTNYGHEWMDVRNGFTRTVPEGKLEICVPTVMHSGTHILRFCILQGYYKMTPDAKHLFNGTSGNKMHVFHLNHDQFPREYIYMMDAIPVFSSLRHPYRVWQSFVKRTEHDRINYRLDKFNIQWRRLIDIVDKYDPLYVHVDVPEIRDEQVRKMGESLDLDLSFDWKVDAKSGSVCGTHQIDVYEDKRISKEFIDFYNEKLDINRE